MVLKNIFSRNWKTKNKIFLLIKVTRVASTSISNCCLIFENVFTSEGARTIFDFPVVLELVQLLVGLWVSFTFNLRFMFQNSDLKFFIRDYNGNKIYVFSNLSFSISVLTFMFILSLMQQLLNVSCRIHVKWFWW